MRRHEQVMGKVRRLEASGCRVVLLEPGRKSVRRIGLNPMRRQGGGLLGTIAAEETVHQLRSPDVRRKLVILDFIARRAVS